MWCSLLFILPHVILPKHNSSFQLPFLPQTLLNNSNTDKTNFLPTLELLDCGLFKARPSHGIPGCRSKSSVSLNLSPGGVNLLDPNTPHTRPDTQPRAHHSCLTSHMLLCAFSQALNIKPNHNPYYDAVFIVITALLLVHVSVSNDPLVAT